MRVPFLERQPPAFARGSGKARARVYQMQAHESTETTERHYSKWMKARQDRLDSLVAGTWRNERRERTLTKGGLKPT